MWSHSLDGNLNIFCSWKVQWKWRQWRGRSRWRTWQSGPAYAVPGIYSGLNILLLGLMQLDWSWNAGGVFWHYVRGLPKLWVASTTATGSNFPQVRAAAQWTVTRSYLVELRLTYGVLSGIKWHIAVLWTCVMVADHGHLGILLITCSWDKTLQLQVQIVTNLGKGLNIWIILCHFT